ncbi:pyridine nucleotide-disulfide oxidoreductase [Leifsonia sp. Root227]|uniref:dihydrolipoyl dehydrogenase family protein n=1 Tax=Leifsonia sp. Root227 TaxID=1736496 RepID=UPI0006F554B2|nr:NAD(P)/FAD-dependent oxidoreductase [Leifsonia sp. Root227]KRC50466.1 pyridine nucleotide-disulfide oxidoreductase [Leifsonia sp. Root227]
MSGNEYDVIVIGAGAVGENVADRAVQGGMRTVIVEAELVGGECSYWACMPSKALLRSGALLRAAQKVGGTREAVTGPLDVEAVLRRRDVMTSDWKDDGQVEWLNGAGIDLVRGHAVITAAREVTVTADDGTVTVLTAKHAVAVCTGSAALLPDVPGLRESEPWTSRDATSVQRVPVSLAILGGGVVGVEMATAYAGFGTEVHLISRSGLLGGNEPFAGELVADSLRELGATLHLDASPTSVARTDDDGFLLTLDDGSTVEADELLVATGRIPHTADLGLEAFGLEGGAWLSVDDSMRVLGSDGEPVDGGWLYGVGDVNHRALLTHQGKYQARAAGDAIAARAKGANVSLEPWGTYVATADHQSVPQVTFTDPEVASVGLTAAAAERAGYRTRVVDYEISGVAGASIVADNYVGKARMVVDEDRGVILGATFVGQDVGELLHSATIAVVGEVPLSRLWHAVPSYPTLSEVWLRLLEAYGRPEE